MDKTFNKGMQQPYIPRGSTIYKPVIPEKKPSDDLVNGLFLVIADGNYFKIKEHLFTNSILMTSKNGSGESALHVILNNSNISNYEKKELIQFAILKGSQVNSYDVNNITPLHLACKYQLTEIVKILLEHGANPNSLDNQYKSPLHYAIIGENVDCPKENETETKLKPIIPKKSTVFKTNQAELDKNIQDLNIAIGELFTNDIRTSKFISQMTESFKEIGKMFPFEIKGFLEDNKQEIINILINSAGTDVDKQQEVFTKVSDVRTTLTEFINLQIKASIDPLLIKSNNIVGWGPDSHQQNRVLTIGSLDEFINEIDRKIASDRHSKLLDLQQYLGAMGSKLMEIEKYNEDFDDMFGNLHIYSIAIGNISGNINISDLSMIRDIMCIDPTNRSKINVQIPIINKNLLYDMINGVYVDHNGNLDQSIPQKKFNMRRIKNPSRIRIRESEIKEYTRVTGTQPKHAKLSFPMEVGGDFNNVPRNTIITTTPTKINGTDENSRGLFFNSKLKLYKHWLDRSYSNLLANVNNINAGIDGDRTKLLPIVYEKYISGALVDILNISFLLATIKDEMSDVKIGLARLYDIVRTYVPALNAHQEYLFLTDQILEDILNVSQTEIEKMCDDVYKSVKNVADGLNSMISLIEMLSASKCIDSYFKYDQFDQFYQSVDSPEITNIMSAPLQKIPEFPQDLGFVGASGPNVILRRKDIIENYMLQTTLSNISTGIVGRRDGLAEVLKPTLGYLFGTPVNVSNLGYDIIKNAQHDIKIREVGQNPEIANNPTPNLIGKIAIKFATRLQKTNFSYPIIGMLYAVFLNMLKYSIVRYVIDLSYKLLTTPINPVAPLNSHENKLKKIVTILNNDVKKFIKFEPGDFGFILTMVGRTVDKYLINFINNNITTQVNTLLMSMIESSLPSHYTKLINDVFANFVPTVLPNVDNGFSVSLDEIFNELFALHQSNFSDEIKKDLSLVAIGNLQEKQTLKKKIHKITNFDSDTQTRNEICYKYDQDVIKTLLDFNAKVNFKDAIGNTPLYYAIETGNILAIQILKQFGAIIYSTTSTNKFGKSAIEYAWDMYSVQLGKNLGNKYAICKIATDKIVQKLKKNELYSNSVPKYTSSILPMTLYLLNHQLYLIGKGYSNGWNYSNNTEFELLIGLNVDSILPLLEMNLTDGELERLDMSKANIESSKIQLDLKSQYISTLQQRQTSLNQELAELNAKHVKTQSDEIRIDQIMLTLQNLINKLNTYSVEVNTFATHIQNSKAFIGNEIGGLKTYIENNKQHLILYDENVVDIYNSVFMDIINHDVKALVKDGKYYYSTDTRTFPSMWKTYLANNPVDYTQVIDLIVKCQQSMLTDTTKSSLEKVRSVAIISQYYTKIINPFCEHYFELEQVYDQTNHALTKIIDIIVHVIKHTICVNLFGFIVKALTKFMLNAIPKHQYDDVGYAYAITQLVIEVIDRSKGDEGSALMNYIFNILPLKLVKSTLQIYEGPNEGEDDLDRRLTPESIFYHINKILESSTTVGIKDKSSLLANLKEYAYPFYIDYSTSFIKEMKKIIDSYLRQLQGDFNLLNILEELTKKY